MKIRSKLEREGGTQVTLGLTNYHFQPNAAGAHVATVADKEHVARFLAIPEGYELYEEGAAPPVVKALPTPPSTNEKSTAPTKPVKQLTRKQLESAYKKKFGKKPNARSKDETILVALTGETGNG